MLAVSEEIIIAFFSHYCSINQAFDLVLVSITNIVFLKTLHVLNVRTALHARSEKRQIKLLSR